MKRALLLIAVVLALLSHKGDAQTLTVAWDPSPPGTSGDTAAVGYLLNVGTEPGVYTQAINVGPALTWTVPVEYDRRYYFALSAFNAANLVGTLSAEVNGVVPAPALPPPPPSADGTLTPPAPWLVDCSGNTWRIEQRATLKNGVHFASGYADQLLLLGCEIYAVATGTWYQADTGWTWIGADPRTPPPPPPVLTATFQSPMFVSVPAAPVSVTFAAPSPSGGVPPYTTTCTPSSGSLFAAGVTTVTCRVSDAAGQTVIGSFTVTVSVPTPEPPPPPPTGCLTGGTLAPVGSRLTQTMKNGEVDPWLGARVREGWVELRPLRKKVKNLTTITMECRGL